MKQITFISDTHTKHKKLTQLLPGGDILICGGDITERGYMMEIKDFLEWFNSLDNYTHKIFIAGNHDFGFQDNPEEVKELLKNYPNVVYLQDELYVVEEPGVPYEDMVKIYGTPWQPEFYNWAFNLPRGEKLKEKWDLIPANIDILVTHGPPHGKLDYVKYVNGNVGCEELIKKVEELKPKINAFGHIHEGYGYVFDGDTHFINAANLNGRYEFKNKPVTVKWDKKTNEIIFVD
jgi:Icc-related predicted phosphoesterase